MSNRLRINLEGKRVVMKGEGTEAHRTVLCTGGFGCSTETMGSRICGIHEETGEEITVSGREVEKLAE